MAGLRRLLKFIIAVFFYYSGLLALCAFFKNRYGESTNPKILMYHRILDDNRKDQAEIQSVDPHMICMIGKVLQLCNFQVYFFTDR